MSSLIYSNLRENKRLYSQRESRRILTQTLMLDRLDGVFMGVKWLMVEFSRELDDAEAPVIQLEPPNFQAEH